MKATNKVKEYQIRGEFPYVFVYTVNEMGKYSFLQEKDGRMAYFYNKWGAKQAIKLDKKKNKNPKARVIIVLKE